MKIILIALVVAVIVTLSVIGLWFSIRIFSIAKSQVKLRKSIDAGDVEAVNAYFKDFAARHNKGREQS